MKHHEGYLKGVRGTEIYYQCWLPEEEPKAVLLVVHGLAEHSGRYMNVVDDLVPEGYGVYGMDHIGHGKSAGQRAYVPRFQDYIETLRKYFDRVRKWQPGKPIFLIGHSMGGLISAAYLLEHQDDLSGAILSGPSIKVPEKSPRATIFLAKVLSILMPRTGLVQLEATGISRDPGVVKDYLNDPLVYSGKITARLGAEFLKTMKRVSEQLAGIRVPILILQGSDDRLVDPKGAQLLYDFAGSEDRTLNIYDGLYHEVFNEPEHEQVLSDVKTWLEAHLGTRAWSRERGAM